MIADLGRKYTDDDITLELYNQAADYLEEYKGNFEFLVNMKPYANSLSKAQARGVLNCMLAEQKRVANIKLQTAEKVIPDGIYTIDFKDDHVTIKLKDGGDKFKHAQIASFLYGPNNDMDYIGFAFVKGQDFSIWKKFQGTSYVRQTTALAVLLHHDDPSMYGLAYALQSGNCYRCGRTLTVPASLYRGMGPICAAKA